MAKLRLKGVAASFSTPVHPCLYTIGAAGIYISAAIPPLKGFNVYIWGSTKKQVFSCLKQSLAAFALFLL